MAGFIKDRSKLLFYIIILLVGLFLCFGYMTGSDWRAYELEYNNLENSITYDSNIEYGYFIYMLPFVVLGIDFWYFFIFTKIILYLSICFFLKKFIPNNFYFAFAIFYCYLAIFLFIDNPMRFLIASTIYLFAFKYVLEKNMLKYLLICMISFLFHKSFLLMVPLYFILNINFNTKYTVISFIAFNVLIHMYSEQLINLFHYLDYFIDFNYQDMSQKISSYILSEDIEDKQFSYGLIARYIVFILLIVFKNKIEKRSKYGNIAFNCSIISLFISRLAFIWPISFRLAIPLSIFYCVAIAMVISCSTGIAKFKYFLLIFFIFSGVLYSQITSEYKYIPYTSYFGYLGSDKPSYDFRSDYNFINSPYKDKSPR